MTYYEELGVGPSANVLEIRQAYRLLARLVHPDHQQDPHCKQLAEDQMKRLNEVLATLSNPEKRKEYDTRLKGAKALQTVQFELYPAEPVGGQIWRWIVQYGAWGVTAILATLCLVLLSLSPSNSPDAAVGVKTSPPKLALPTSEKRENVPPPPFLLKSDDYDMDNGQGDPERMEKNPTPQANGKKSIGSPANFWRGRGRSTVNALPPTKSAAHSAAPSEIVERPSPEPSRQTLQSTALPPVVPPAKLAEATFAGNWFFAANVNENEESGLYPPEYIELVLSESNGILIGRFRARYHVPDRAVFPEVAFQIEGRGGLESSVHVGWKAQNGAKGVANLKLLTSNSLEMNWWATTLGRQQGLVSGTAVLIKRLER